MRKAGAGAAAVAEEQAAVVLVGPVLVVAVEVLARAAPPAQAAVIRALPPIQRQIPQARPGAAAPILQQAIRTPEVWTPTLMV